MRVALVLGVAVAVCLAPRASHAQATETLEGGAQVTKVDGKRVTIDHGAKAGITMGLTGDVFPVTAHDGTNETIDLDVRLAVGRVTEVRDDSATVTIDAIAGPIEVGAVFSFKLSVPADGGGARTRGRRHAGARAGGPLLHEGDPAGEGRSLRR
jgi:hypothetical protein